jgi:hypothetical protein
VVDSPPLTERELRFLRELVKRGAPFLIVGLSAAALQGAPVVTQDVDLWIKDLTDSRFRDALREVGGAYVPPTSQRPPMLAGPGLELFDLVLTMHGLEPFEEELARSVDLVVGDVALKVLPLSRILASKRAANRPKDRLVVPVLEQVLAVQAAAEATDDD